MKASTLALAQAAAVGGGGAEEAWANVIAEVPLFAGLSDRQLRRIARLGTVQRFQPRSEVVTKGGVGDAAYIVLDGVCEVVRGRGRPRLAIGAGSIIGEMALLDGAPRSGTVRATSEVTTLRLERKTFLRIIRDAPIVMLRLLETLATRVREAEADTVPA